MASAANSEKRHIVRWVGGWWAERLVCDNSRCSAVVVVESLGGRYMAVYCGSLPTSLF